MRLICVTGMHRSGTSLAANLLHLLGVELGPERALMGATEANPRGHWEAAAISDLDNEIMEHLGGRWHRLPAFPPGWEHERDLDPFRRRARQLLDELFAGAAAAGFKDPRVSLLLPFWRTVTPVDATVLVLRPPDEVAGSLGKRDGFDPEHAASLWIDHVAAAWTADPRRHAVTYAELLAEPQAVAQRLAAALDLPEPTDEVLARIAGTADPGLQRNAGFDAGDGPQQTTAAALYALLTGPAAEHAGPVLARLLAERNAVRLRDADLERVRHELRVAQRDLRTAAGERDRALGRIDQLTDEAAAAGRRLRELQATVNRYETTVARHKRDIEQLRARAERWEREYRLLHDRKVVRAGLAAASVLKPAFRAVRRLRGQPDPRRGPVAGSARPGRPDHAEVPRRPHRAASEEEAAAMAERLAAQAAPAPDGARPRVSVLVLTRDGEHHLRRLLPALERTDYDDLEVLVVDNGSSDGTAAYLDGLSPRFPLRVIRNADNASFSAGNNQALAEASGELVLLCNNDIEPVTPGWLARMVAALHEHDAVAVGARLVYPRRPGLDNAGDLVHPDLTLQHRGIDFVSDPDGIPRARNLGAGEDPTGPAAGAVREVVAVTAACMLVRRDALEAAGGLDEGYRYGTEDVDLCLRLREHGGRIVYDGQAVLWHHEFGTQNRQGRQTKRRNRLHNRQLFVDRWGARVFREVLSDRLRGARQWSEEPLHVAVTLTRDDPEAGWGDYYTAHELGDALAALGWRVSYVERYGERWYDLPDGVDVVISLLDLYEVHRLPAHIVKVAWVRNWTDRWISHPWFEDYDLVLASSRRSKELIERHTAHVAHLLPLATNPERFQPRDPDPELATDVLFVGNYWEKPRGIMDALPYLDGVAEVAVYGARWEQVDTVRPHHRGVLPYERLPAAYASAKLVLDDTAGPTRPYAAVNARVFDALAAGALVVSDNPDGVHALFDDEFPVYRDGEELRRAVAGLLADPARIGRLARRYRRTVVRYHTYRHRAEQIRDYLLDWCEARRVGIRIGVPDREQAPAWGDTHYARDLRRQLERRGNPTRVLLLDQWDAHHAARDDVALHLLGLSELRTRPGQCNVLWNISHPEKVTPDLCDRYDLVLVASDRFAAELAAQTATPVAPLHQATDPDRFRPATGGPHHRLLFVGNSRRTRRRIVDDLVAGGATDGLAVYGRDWTPDLIDPRYLRGEHVDNDELHRFYAGADIVLNDHWDGMRAHGFLSNRLYDALASGAFVISDHVDGIDDEFDGAVVTYHDPGDLAEKVQRYLDDPEARRKLADRGRQAVLERHTFAHRTEELLGHLQPLLVAHPAWVGAPPYPPVPPAALRFMGEDRQAFLDGGEELVADLRAVAALEPDSDIVELGCGYGRLPHALLRWPDHRGRYLGLDILAPQVRWCQEQLALAGDGRTGFRHLDVRNERYNPGGAVPAAEADLGLEPASADVAVAVSVFTHMFPEEVANYLRRLRPVLRPGGRLYATFLLLDDERRAAVAAGRAGYRLREHSEVCLVSDSPDPLRAVALDQAWVYAQLADAGFVPDPRVRHGTWHDPSGGGERGVAHWQDVLVAVVP